MGNTGGCCNCCGIIYSMQPQVSSVKVKINNHGRYTWEINVLFDTDYQETVRVIKKIDTLLRDEFPDAVSRGSGRVANIDED